MNVPFQLRVPIDQAAQMNAALARLRALHEEDFAKITKKLKVKPDEATIKAHAALVARGRRLSVHGVVRLVLTKGIAALQAAKSEALLSEIAEDGIVRGRQRNA